MSIPRAHQNDTCRTIAPNLKVYKALPADGIHPKHWNVGFWPQFNQTYTACDAEHHSAPCDTYTNVLQGGRLR